MCCVAHSASIQCVHPYTTIQSENRKRVIRTVDTLICPIYIIPRTSKTQAQSERSGKGGGDGGVEVFIEITDFIALYCLQGERCVLFVSPFEQYIVCRAMLGLVLRVKYLQYLATRFVAPIHSWDPCSLAFTRFRNFFPIPRVVASSDLPAACWSAENMR